MSDRARVSVRVSVTRELAFSVFTEDIDRWWGRGKRYRMREASTLMLQPRVGGRFTETLQGAEGARVWDMGEVLVWEPPKRLVLAWRSTNFAPEDPSTEVEVTFERAIGQAGEGTLVTIEHRGWRRLRPDHPARHGQDLRAFYVTLARYWGDLASALRDHTDTDARA